MLPGATERAQAAGVSRTPAMLFQDFVLGRSKGLAQEGQRKELGLRWEQSWEHGAPLQQLCLRSSSQMAFTPHRLSRSE